MRHDKLAELACNHAEVVDYVEPLLVHRILL